MHVMAWSLIEYRLRSSSHLYTSLGEKVRAPRSKRGGEDSSGALRVRLLQAYERGFLRSSGGETTILLALCASDGERLALVGA